MTPDGGVRITVCPNGPLLVEGPARLQDVEGSPVNHERNVLALCRCGRSRRKPLCDGSHRQSRFGNDAEGGAMVESLRSP